MSEVGRSQSSGPDVDRLRRENERLREELAEAVARKDEAEETLRAIQSGQVDALMIGDQESPQVFTLHAAERFYLRLAQEAARVGTWDCDLTRADISWSEGIWPLIGLEPRTAPVSLSFLQSLIHPEDLPRAESRIRQIVAEGEDYYDEFRIVRPDGAVCWIAVRGRVFRDHVGEPRRLIGVTIDITERINTETALRESEERYRSLLTQIRDHAIFQTDLAGRPVTWDAGVRQVLGYGKSEFIGLDLGVLTPADEPPPPPVEPRLLDADGVQSVGEDRWVVRKDGERIWVSGTTSVLRDDAGRVVSFIRVMRDQTPWKRASEALQEANYRKDEFLAMLAHELRNPLASISSAVQLLVLPQLTPDERGETLSIIGRQAWHLTRIIDDLLDVARITRGKIDLRTETLDLRTILRSAVDTVRPLIAQKGHHLKVSLPDEEAVVRGDATRLEQVFTNLVQNAAKYTPDGGIVRVQLRPHDGRWQVDVEDTGLGISPKILPMIFDIFTQADRTLHRSEGGLGIGLTLVRRLVELHDGTVTAYSAGEGEGSTFRVELPAAAGTARPAAKAPAASPAEVASPRRVMIVEDNPDTANMMKKLLTLWGYSASVALTGPAALEAVDEVRPQIILLDVGLPGLDGYQVARRIRKMAELTQPKIIILSGYGQEADREQSRAAGADHHLVKPVEFETLAHLLSQFSLTS